MISAILHGAADGMLGGLQAALAASGVGITGEPPAELLLNLGGPAPATIASAEAFAAAARPGSLVINLLHKHDKLDWPGAHNAATLWAFTRYAALAWAPRGIRVNAIGLGISPHLPTHRPGSAGYSPAQPASLADIASTILAVRGFPSMTGQLVSLGS
jgi:hypothetical protein